MTIIRLTSDLINGENEYTYEGDRVAGLTDGNRLFSYNYDPSGRLLDYSDDTEQSTSAYKAEFKWESGICSELSTVNLNYVGVKVGPGNSNCN